MRRIGLALVAIALAAGGAVWWVRLPAPQRQDSAGVGTASPAAARGAPPTQATVPPARVTLQINGGLDARVVKGEALFFMVSLTGTSPSSEFRVGAAGRPWIAALRFESADARAFTLRHEQLGPPVSYTFDSNARSNASAAAGPNEEVAVTAARVAQVEFGIGPDEAARLEAGAHSVRVVLSLDRAANGLSQLVSNPVSFTVLMPPEFGGNQVTDPKRRFIAAARFHLRAQQWAEAHRIALQLVTRQDADTLAYTLLADALNGLERNDEAIAAYRAALASLPATSDESPDYLFARMDQVEQRIETAQHKKE